MADSGMTLQVSPDLVRPVIEQKIHAAIVAELCRQDQAQIVSDVVARVLNQKVDSDGKPDSYGYRQSKTYVEWLCEKAIRECAKSAVQEWLNKNKPKIEKQFAGELAKRGNQFGKLFVDGMADSLKSSWAFKVDVSFDTQKES